ncbi:MAG: hypothetical protein PSV22_04205, partial [Pseudolabrys sp.]|nr:hypothetical protein [Pseudolabrys sp.]
MPNYHLPRFFVPDDKDVADMLHACGTSHDKMWDFAASYGILGSKEDVRERMLEYVSRLPMDWRKLARLYEMNSSKDRDEKYSSRELTAKVTLEKVNSIVTEVRTERNDDLAKEKYTVTQKSADVLEVNVTYHDPDFSKTQSLQYRERDIKILVEKKGEKLDIRHHSNERATQIVDQITQKIAAALGANPPQRTLSFSGIRDPKVRTQFFIDLINKIPGSRMHNVSSVKVYRLRLEKAPVVPHTAPDEEPDQDEEAKEVAAEVRKVVLSGANLILSDEYRAIEARGFFIGSITWVSELQESDKPRFEMAAEFNDPDRPSNMSYMVSGKYTMV